MGDCPRRIDNSAMSDWYLYLIRVKKGHLYTGIAKDIEARFAEHVADGKKCAKYLRGKGPLKLLFSQKIGSRSLALKAEAAVKKMSKGKKEEMVSEWMERLGKSNQPHWKR